MNSLKHRLEHIRDRAKRVAAALERGFDLVRRYDEGELMYVRPRESLGRVLEDRSDRVRVRVDGKEYTYFRSEEWAEVKEEFLASSFADYTNRELADQLRCSVKAIEKRLRKLNLKRRFVWTEDADRYLLSHSERPNSELARKLGTTVASVKGRLQRLKGRGAQMRERRQTFSWGPKEDQFLLDHLDRPNRWLAEKLGTTVGSIKGRLRRLRKKNKGVPRQRRISKPDSAS